MISNLKKVLLHFDSSDRDVNINTGSDEFILNIVPARTNVKFFELVSLELPFTWYPIRTGFNDNLYFVDSGSTSRTGVMPEGSFTISEILTNIKNAMEAETTDTFTVTRNSNTRKITIVNDIGSYELTTSNNVTAIWEIIGFSTSSDLTGAATYTGDRVYNLSGS